MSYQPSQSPPQSGQPTPPLSGGIPTADERTWAMIAHLSAFAGFCVPLLGHIGGPLLVLLLRGDSSPFVSYHARESLNFNITVAIGFFVSAVLCIVLIGIPMLLAVAIGWFVLTIVAAVRARDGFEYRYPMTLRLIPER
jgi:uncharacterized Tic20 family protein